MLRAFFKSPVLRQPKARAQKLRRRGSGRFEGRARVVRCRVRRLLSLVLRGRG